MRGLAWAVEGCPGDGFERLRSTTTHSRAGMMRDRTTCLHRIVRPPSLRDAVNPPPPLSIRLRSCGIPPSKCGRVSRSGICCPTKALMAPHEAALLGTGRGPFGPGVSWAGEKEEEGMHLSSRVYRKFGLLALGVLVISALAGSPALA